jgi:hypothetical protein
MVSAGVISIDFIDEEMRQQMLQISDDIAYLLKLVNDPQRYGELIQILDPTVDKVDQHAIKLQAKLTEELDKRAKEFEISVGPLDNQSVMSKSQPPNFLSDVEAKEWQKLASSEASPQQLADFKRTLIKDFKNKTYKHPQIEKLTEQNISIRGILNKIRQTLII